MHSLHDDDTLGRGRLEVDVVDAGAGAADDLHIGGAVQHLPGHFGVRAHDQSVVFLERAPNKSSLHQTGYFFPHIYAAAGARPRSINRLDNATRAHERGALAHTAPGYQCIYFYGSPRGRSAAEITFGVL
jgi:hypothetical protein